MRVIKMRTKVERVDVIKYEPNRGIEDGFTCVNKTVKCGGTGCDTCNRHTHSPYINYKGRKLCLFSGAYIVKQENGDINLLTESMLNEKYEIVE